VATARAISQTSGATVYVGPRADLEDGAPRVVSAGGRTIVVFASGGEVHALDNRCPHMGFPLSQGTVRDGILTCHWHHARFDLAGGSTFDPFADDVTSFAVEVRDGEVWVDSTPRESDRRTHWLRKLDEGLEQNLRLVLAKSVIGLDELDATALLLERAALFGTRNRAAGWSTGLSILTAMANTGPLLAEADRPRALYQGLVHVAGSTAGQPPDFDLEPLETSEQRPEVFRAWFRGFLETRSEAPAERTLRTAIASGMSPVQVADMVFAASTDHVFMDVGHTLDFANKAFELVDHVGWEHAAAILPSIIPLIAGAERMEEAASWQHPVDLPRLIAAADAELDTAIEAGGERLGGWDGHRPLAESILDDDPATTLRAVVEAARAGAPLTELAATVAYAAARRAVHFHVANEFGDWDTVHHTFTYAHALYQAMRRAPSRELTRGILHGAAAVYLDRFLNVPKQPIAGEDERTWRAGSGDLEALLAEFDRQQRVDETADLAAELIAAGRREELVATLGTALLREDSGFHEFQIFEAAVRLAKHFGDRPEAGHVLLGAARFLTAHSPTVRAAEQTYDTAARLHRGEFLYEAADGSPTAAR
jgi:nitrite reductase/ring-hydroxylating ferredoxin subunit